MPRLTAPILRARAEALLECIGHLQQTWTDDELEFEQGFVIISQLEKQVDRLEVRAKQLETASKLKETASCQ